jgi:hypothetical protein
LQIFFSICTARNYCFYFFSFSLFFVDQQRFLNLMEYFSSYSHLCYYLPVYFKHVFIVTIVILFFFLPPLCCIEKRRFQTKKMYIQRIQKCFSFPKAFFASNLSHLVIRPEMLRHSKQQTSRSKPRQSCHWSFVYRYLHGSYYHIYIRK